MLCLSVAVLSVVPASAAMAVKISPAGATIQLKATNMTLQVWGTEKEAFKCELWQTSGKINALGTLPVNLEAPSFGKGTGECTFGYGGGPKQKARVVEDEAETLEASAKTAASIGKGRIVLQWEEFGKLRERCKVEIGLEPYKGIWANGTTKEGKVVTPSTLTLSKLAVDAVSAENCILWGAFSQEASLSATFSVTDTTNPNQLVVLE